MTLEGGKKKNNYRHHVPHPQKLCTIPREKISWLIAQNFISGDKDRVRSKGWRNKIIAYSMNSVRTSCFYVHATYYPDRVYSSIEEDFGLGV